MKKLILSVFFTLAALLPYASSAETQEVQPDFEGKAVDSFRIFGSVDGWSALDRNTLIVWTSPGRPYLLNLRNVGAGSLQHAYTIAVTSSLGRVSAKFDNVIVDGWRYPITSIYRLDRTEAKDLLSRSRRPS